MRQCGACGAGTRRLHPFGLCHSCHNRLERWVANQVALIHRDLDLLSAFEAYCWQRETAASGPPAAGV